MVEFNIIEEKTDDKYIDYVELYNEGLTLKNICEKLSISMNNCNTFYHHAINEGLIEPRKTRKKTRKKPKYYNYNIKGGYYAVYSPLINGKQNNFGIYNTEEEAKFVVEELKKVNWNRKCLKNIRLKAMELFPLKK